MTLSPARLAAAVIACCLVLAGLGWGWAAIRFGTSPDAAAARLRADVGRRLADSERRVERLAGRVARDQALVGHLAALPDQAPALFARLGNLSRADGAGGDVSASVYASVGPAATYRVVAWSSGPSGDLTSDRVSGPASLFVAADAAGLRLVSVKPIEPSGRRVGVVAAATLLTQAEPGTPTLDTFELTSTFGPVRVAAAGAGGALASPDYVVLSSASGAPLLEVRFSPDMLAAARQTFVRRVLCASALPLVALLFPATAAVLRRRRQTRRTGAWFGWTAVLTGLVALAAVGLVALARAADVGPVWIQLLVGLAALALAASFPVAAWWRRWPRHAPGSAPTRFVLEQLLAGAGLAGGVALLAWVLRDPAADFALLTRWQLPILSTDIGTVVELAAVLLAEIALGWAAAVSLAVVAARWKLGWRRASGWMAAALWLLPTAALMLPPLAHLPVPGVAAAGAAAIFGLLAGALRHTYRHTTQAVKLLLVFGALLLPVFSAYPLAASSRDRAIRTLIEQEYAPATAAAQRADHLHAMLTTAQAEIDRLPDLGDLLVPVPTGVRVESQAAFHVWSQTTLSRERLTSEIELFGPDRRLVSRFALNVPQFEAAYRTGTEVWDRSGCSWDAYAEVNTFGAEERRMLHAERGVCDASGRFVGAIVVHVLPDYRALPFISSQNPYLDVIGRAANPQSSSRVTDLQVVVYGWNLQPRFSSSSGRVTWPLPAGVDDRLYRSRDPFWAGLTSEDRAYHVYFLSDRVGIYAVGYPASTLFQHLSRLSELVAIAATLFVALLIGLTVYAPFASADHGRTGPLRLLLQEIRTSFYRKLFLFFVLAAIGPVLLFAAAFSAYTMARFRADIESEATGVVTVARRVFEELSAAARPPDREPAAMSDDAMVWIRQVIDQDVNLYDGARLVATSQRDLFDSGLLPTRTPAAVYRAIALDRAPSHVATDRIGTFQYLVAAAPVPARGRDAVLSVPLASRQREIEREIDDLNRGVLVGAVVVVLFAAGLGASVAGRVSDPVSRLTRATRLIAAGKLDVRLVADTADELGRLVEDFNAMAGTLVAQRAELARTQQLKAWAEMARQVAHEIKNPLTPIQLAAEHLQHVHEDARRPLGPVFDQCVDTVLRQVRLLRQIASEFSSFGSETVARPAFVSVADLIEGVVGPYRLGLAERIRIEADAPPTLPAIWVDRTLVARALTNLVENAIQAMPQAGTLSLSAAAEGPGVTVRIRDTGLGMDAESVRRAFEPYYSTRTAGSGLGLANARRNIELCGGTIALTSAPGSGTTVTLTLPSSATRSDEAAGASPPGR